MCLIPVAAQAIEWSPLRIEGKVIEGWYQNTTNKNLQAWNTEGFVREYTPKEFETYTKELEGYGGYSGENSTSTSDIVKTIMRDTPGINEANAEDAAKVLENSRNAPPDAPGGGAEGELGRQTIDGLDGVAEDAGTLGEAGAPVDTAAGAGVLPFLGPVVLGAAAFTVGAYIGNGLDELLHIPTAAKFFESEEKALPGGEPKIHFEHEQCINVGGGEEKLPEKSLCINQPGYYLTCRGNELSETLVYKPYSGHPKPEEHYGCVGSPNLFLSESCPESGAGSRCTEPGYFETDTHEYDILCHEPSETEHPLVQNCAGSVEPLTVPRVKPLTVGTEEENSHAGLEHSPRPELAPEIDTKPDIQTQHLPKSAPYELLLPAPGENGYSKGDPEPRKEMPLETEIEREVGKSPRTEAEPLSHYIEKPENSPNKTEAETEPEPEAEAPGAVGPPALPGFKFPELGVLCKGFPFGVPCWIINTVSSWSASGSCPTLGTEEFLIKGYKIKSTETSLCPLEPIMEKARPAMLIFATIGLVVLFYRFARGGSPPSGGGTEDTGGDQE